MATLTGKLVAETYKALLKLIDNDVITGSEKQISDGLGGSTGVFIDTNGFMRASKFIVTGGNSGQFLKGDGSLDGTGYLPVGTTTSAIAEGSRLYFTQARVLETTLTGFVSTEGTVTAADSILSAINKIWWNIENGGGGGGGYVPYTGATQNLNLGTYGLISDYIQFNLAPTSIPTTAGTMSWNATDGTADLKMGGGNVTLQVGQEELVRVVNKTGANLLEANYQAVRISGAQGNRLKVDLAKADNDANSADTIGIVTETINNNAEGFVTAVGLVRNIDTTGDLQEEEWADGDMLYLSAATAGVITNIKPEAPEHGVRMGYVVRAHKTQGQIYVKVDNGYELDELHNVLITDPLDEDVLFYDEANLLWINKNIYSAINATDVGKSLLGILNAEDTTPVTTKPRGIRINVDNTVSALDVGTQGYLPFYDETDFYIDSPVFTDGDQVFIGGDDSYLSVNSKLTVVGGNLTVDDNWGIHLGLYQILFRYNATGELRFGTGVPNDFITFFANSTERMRLSASGFLGIGVTNPASMIHAKATTAYPKIIIDNASPSGGGMFSAYQNGTETAMFGVSGAWLIDNSSDAAIVATRAGQGIQFYTNGSNSEKMGINSDGNVFVGQTPTYFAGATQLIVRGKTGAGFLGVQHYDMSIRGSINTFNSVFQVGTSTFHAVAVIVEDIERARFNSAGRMLLGTTTDNTVDKLQIDGSLIATAIKKTGGTSSQYLMADGSVSTLASYVPTSRTLTINGTGYDLTADRSWSVGTVTSVSATVPTGFAISGSPITTSGTLAITFAAGYALPTTIKQSNWDDAYTFVTEFPSQTGNSGKYLTTNGSTLSWGTVTAGVSSFNTRTGNVTLLDTDVTTALGYTPYNGTTNPNGYITSAALSGYVPTSRTLTINGTTYDLSANRAWVISAGSSARNVSTFTATAGQTVFTISGGYTPNLVDVFVNGARLTGVDFTATNGTTIVLADGVRLNDIVDVVNYTDAATSGITGSGTSGYLTKWSGTSAITNSVIQENSGSIGINGAAVPDSGDTRLQINGAQYGTLSLKSTSVNSIIRAHNPNNILYVGNISNHPLSFITNDAERMRITAAGNVGIGLTTPVGFESSDLVAQIYNVTSGSSRAMLRLTNSYSGSAWGNGGWLSVDSSLDFYIANSEAAALIFQTSASERMRVTSGGHLGIGTNTPANNGAGETGVEIRGALYPMFTVSTTTNSLQMGIGGSATAYLNSTGAYSLAFGTNGLSRLTLDLNGAARFSREVYIHSASGTANASGFLFFNYSPNNTGSRSWKISNDQNVYGDFSIQNSSSQTGAISNTIIQITSAGTVGIGTISPALSVGTGLVVSNSTYVQFRIQSTSQSAGIEWVSGTGYRYEVQASNGGEWFVYNRTLETYRLMIKANGDFLVGKTASNDTVAGFDLSENGKRLSISSPDNNNNTNTYLMYSTSAGYRFYVGWGGQIYATSTSIAGLSDITLKENIRDLDTGLAEILKIKPRRFDWKESAKIYEKNVAGFVAQELENVLPELVYDYQYDKNVTKKSIKMANLIPTMVKATQELNYKFETQAEKIARLETRVQQLEAK